MRKPCGCQSWETSGGDLEIDFCDTHLPDEQEVCDWCGEAIDADENVTEHNGIMYHVDCYKDAQDEM